MTEAIRPHKTVDSATNGAEQRVLDSAIRCFASKGYSGTSIREIIQMAGVTAPVLYYYFKSKEDLFCHLVEQQFEQYYGEMDRILGSISGCRERLVSLIRYSFAQAIDSPDTVRMLLQYFFSTDDHLRLDKQKLTELRFERIVEIMRQGIVSGELRGAEPEQLASAFSGIMDMPIMSVSINEDHPVTPEVGEMLVDLFLKGAESRA